MSTANRFTVKSATYLIPKIGNKILLSRRYKTGWMDGKYSLISGHLDGNESVHNAMIREAIEEAGIKIESQDLIPATVLHRKSADAEYIDFFFAIEKWEGTPKICEPDKCDSLEWFEMDNLPENVLPYIKEVLHNFKNKVAFSASGWK